MTIYIIANLHSRITGSRREPRAGSWLGTGCLRAGRTRPLSRPRMWRERGRSGRWFNDSSVEASILVSTSSLHDFESPNLECREDPRRGLHERVVVGADPVREGGGPLGLVGGDGGDAGERAGVELVHQGEEEDDLLVGGVVLDGAVLQTAGRGPGMKL